MPVVSGVTRDPSNTAQGNVRVTITLNVGAPMPGFVGGATISGVYTTITPDSGDNIGAWSTNLTPNSTITPAGTYYLVVETWPDGTRNRYTLVVPDDDGPYTVDEVLAAMPAGQPIPRAAVEAKGDLIVGYAPGMPGRLPAGSDGQVLTRDPDAPLGVKWATPSSDGGSGVPDGGTTGQVLAKNSSTDGDADWKTLTASDVGADPAGSAAAATSSALQKASNLSDVASASAARANLGLGGAAVLNVGTTAGTVAAGDDARIDGALQRSVLTTKGDLPAATGAATVGRRSVGTPGQLLTVDPTQPTGIAWADPAAVASDFIVWSGASYPTVDATKPKIYLGPQRPAGAAVGSVRIGVDVTSPGGSGGSGGGETSTDWGPQINATVEPTVANVGYRGDSGLLTVLAYGDPIPSDVWGGGGGWADGQLILNTGTPVIEGYEIQAAIETRVDTVIRHCIIRATPEQFFPVQVPPGRTLEISDTTIIGDQTGDIWPLNHINAEGRVVAERVLGYGGLDGFHANFLGDDYESGQRFTQCFPVPYIRTVDDHTDCFQFYSPSGGVDVEGYITLEYCSAPSNVYGPDGAPINSTVITGALAGEGIGHLKAVGCRFPAGGYHVYIGARIHAEFTNNRFGRRNVAPHAEFGLLSWTDEAVAEVWESNVDDDGNPVLPG